MRRSIVAGAPARTQAFPGLVQVPIDDPIQQVFPAMWRPDYPQIEAIGP